MSDTEVAGKENRGAVGSRKGQHVLEYSSVGLTATEDPQQQEDAVWDFSVSS